MLISRTITIELRSLSTAATNHHPHFGLGGLSVVGSENRRNPNTKPRQRANEVQHLGPTLTDRASVGLLLMALCLLPSLALAAQPAGLDLAELDDWRIVVSDDAISSEQYAAEELQSWIEAATGSRLLIVSDDSAQARNVFIGDSPALRSSKLAFVLQQDYAPEELRFVIQADNIAIVGGRPRGVLYGVYQFLEDVVGIRFLTKDHTHVPRLTSADERTDANTSRSFVRELDFSYRPPLEFRLAYYSEALYEPYLAARLRLNGKTPGMMSILDAKDVERVGGHARGGLIIHSINGWLDQSFNEHPEYYALWEGKRNPANACMTDSEVRRIVTAKVLGRAGYWPQGHVIHVAQEDTNVTCQCESCRALMERHGNQAGQASAQFLDFVNHVAKAVGKVRPDVKVGTLAYGPTREPPENMRAEPNVRVQYATYHACLRHGFGRAYCPNNLVVTRQMREWAEICDDVVYWHYMVNFRDFLLPPVNIEGLESQIRTMVANNGKSIFFQGPGGGRNVPFADLMIYVLGRLAWNPELNDTEVINEFLELHYGPGAKPIREFLALVAKASRNAPKHENCNAPMDAYGLTEELGRQGIELFKEATRLAETAAERERIEKASICAYRLALGNVWYGNQPADTSQKQLRRYQRIARKTFQLAKKHGVSEHGESWPMKGAEAKVRKALGISDG